MLLTNRLHRHPLRQVSSYDTLRNARRGTHVAPPPLLFRVLIFSPYDVFLYRPVQVYDRDGNQIAHFVKGDPYLKVKRDCS